MHTHFLINFHQYQYKMQKNIYKKAKLDKTLKGHLFVLLSGKQPPLHTINSSNKTEKIQDEKKRFSNKFSC